MCKVPWLSCNSDGWFDVYRTEEQNDRRLWALDEFLEQLHQEFPSTPVASTCCSMGHRNPHMFETVLAEFSDILGYSRK